MASHGAMRPQLPAVQTSRLYLNNLHDFDDSPCASPLRLDCATQSKVMARADTNISHESADDCKTTCAGSDSFPRGYGSMGSLYTPPLSSPAASEVGTLSQANAQAMGESTPGSQSAETADMKLLLEENLRLASENKQLRKRWADHSPSPTQEECDYSFHMSGQQQPTQGFQHQQQMAQQQMPQMPQMQMPQMPAFQMMNQMAPNNMQMAQMSQMGQMGQMQMNPNMQMMQTFQMPMQQQQPQGQQPQGQQSQCQQSQPTFVLVPYCNFAMCAQPQPQPQPENAPAPPAAPGNFGSSESPQAQTAAEMPPNSERTMPGHMQRLQAARKSINDDVHVAHVERDSRTTVMLRNLPNNYTQQTILAMLDSEGFAGKYDFVYLPMDFKTCACLGYAFVNLVDPDLAPLFWEAFDGYNKWAIPSRKVCFVSWCGPHQGYEAHVERYRNSPLMHPMVPDEYKPMVFADGARVPFPVPTKKPRVPRARTSGGGQ